MHVEYQNQQKQDQSTKFKLQYTANVDPKEKEHQGFDMSQNDYLQKYGD